MALRDYLMQDPHPSVGESEAQKDCDLLGAITGY